MRAETTYRVRQRIREMAAARQFKQTLVAKRLGVDQGSVNRYVHGPTPLTLAFLDAVSLESGVPLGEIVSPPGAFKEVDADEAALLRHLRRWPKSVLRSLVAFVGFFADESPVEQQTRNMHELWRRMGRKERERLYAAALLMKEGRLPPDQVESLVRHLPGDLPDDVADDGESARTDGNDAA